MEGRWMRTQAVNPAAPCCGDRRNCCCDYRNSACCAVGPPPYVVGPRYPPCCEAPYGLPPRAYKNYLCVNGYRPSQRYGLTSSDTVALDPAELLQCQQAQPFPPNTRPALPSTRPPPVSFEQALSEGSPRPPLQVGDRVVWISDTGPEYGVVKWLGKLPDVGNDWMVGVEFDNPVGSGTGKYQEQQLFEAQLNHASLVPIIGLMKAEDFLGDHTPYVPGSKGTPPRPHRKKKAPESCRETSLPRSGLY